MLRLFVNLWKSVKFKLQIITFGVISEITRTFANLISLITVIRK